MELLGESFWEGGCKACVTGVTMLCLDGGEEERCLGLEETFWSLVSQY